MIKAIREIAVGSAAHNHAHDMDDLADDPPDRAFGFARLKAMPGFDRLGFDAGEGDHQPGAVPGFQIHLQSAFCSNGGISVC